MRHQSRGHPLEFDCGTDHADRDARRIGAGHRDDSIGAGRDREWPGWKVTGLVVLIADSKAGRSWDKIVHEKWTAQAGTLTADAGEVSVSSENISDGAGAGSGIVVPIFVAKAGLQRQKIKPRVTRKNRRVAAKSRAPLGGAVSRATGTVAAV